MPLLQIEELSPAEAKKEEGNAAFKSGRYEEAVRCYSEAFQLDASLSVVLNNRAMALLKLQRFAEAAEDCRAVLRSEPGNVKAKFRLGCALEGIGSDQEALQAFEEAASMDPKNTEARDRANRLKKALDL